MADQDPGDSGAKPPEPTTPDGATPDGPTGSGRDAPGGTDDDDKLRDAGKAALERERTARREAEQRATEAARRLQELEDAGKSELERAIARLDRQAADLDAERSARQAAETELADLRLLELKRSIGAEVGVPPEAAHRLQGTDARSIRADAQRYLDERKDGNLGVGRGGAAAGRGTVDMNDLIRQASGR